MMTISVMMLKNRPRIPQPRKLRPFIAATTPQMMAAMMLPMATKMPLMQDEACRLRVVLGRNHHGVQHCDLLVLESLYQHDIPRAVGMKQNAPNPQSIRRPSQNECDRALPTEVLAGLRRHVDLLAGLLYHRSVGIQHRQIDLVRIQ